MTKKIKYRITLLRFLISTFVSLVFVACKNTYELEDKHPAAAEEGPHAFYKIFVTTGTFDGRLSGAPGAGGMTNAARADVRCQTEADAIPETGTYKALIADSTRSASLTPTNWVLRATTQYQRLDGTIIGTTNAASIFVPPLTNPINATAGEYSWTGLKDNWTNANNCTNWTSNLGTDYGAHSYATAVAETGYYNWAGYDGYCNSLRHLICVEQ